MSRVFTVIGDEAVIGDDSEVISAIGTVAMWFMPAFQQDNNEIAGFFRLNRAADEFTFFKDAANSLIFGWDVGAVDFRIGVISANYTLLEGAWNSFVGTWDATANETRLELNGVEIGNQLILLTTELLGVRWRMGELADLNESAGGRLALITWDNVVWSAQERAMFHARVHPSTIRPPGAHLWTLEDDSLEDSWGTQILTEGLGPILIQGNPTLSPQGRNPLIKRARYTEAREAVGLQAVGR